MKGIVVKKTLKNRDNTSRMYILPSTFDVRTSWEAAIADKDNTAYDIEIYAEDEFVLGIFLLINMMDSEFILDKDKDGFFEVWVNEPMREAITNDIARFIVKDNLYDRDYVLDMDYKSNSWQRKLNELMLQYKKAVNEYCIKK